MTNTIKATVASGRINVAVPAEWPDSTEVEIHPHDWNSASAEDEESMTPDEIAQVLAAMARVEPLEISDEDRIALDDWERRTKDYSIANIDKGLEDVFR